MVDGCIRGEWAEVYPNHLNHKPHVPVMSTYHDQVDIRPYSNRVTDRQLSGILGNSSQAPITWSKAHFWAWISGPSGAAGWISWKCGILLRRGGLASPVQQHEAAKNANAETTSAEMMRIMGSVDWIWKMRIGWLPSMTGHPAFADCGRLRSLRGLHINRCVLCWGNLRTARSGKQGGGNGGKGNFHRRIGGVIMESA